MALNQGLANPAGLLHSDVLAFFLSPPLRSTPTPYKGVEWSRRVAPVPHSAPVRVFSDWSTSEIADSDEPFRLSFFVFVLENLEHAVINPDLKQASKFGPVLFLAWVQPEHLGDWVTDQCRARGSSRHGPPSATAA